MKNFLFLLSTMVGCSLTGFAQIQKKSVREKDSLLLVDYRTRIANIMDTLYYPIQSSIINNGYKYSTDDSVKLRICQNVVNSILAEKCFKKLKKKYHAVFVKAQKIGGPFEIQTNDHWESDQSELSTILYQKQILDDQINYLLP